MDISLISISHKNAPLEVRARFAFPVEAQEELMRQVIALEYPSGGVRIYQYL